MLESPYVTVILDDEIDIVEILGATLEKKYKHVLDIKTFTDAQEADYFVQKNEVSIVISDLAMPKFHGLDFTRHVLSLERGIQCIIVTGDDSYSSKFECFMNGALGYLLKPMQPERLYAAIDRTILNLGYWKEIIEESRSI